MNQQRRAIIIGATSGIGLEVAKALAAQGWVVGIAGRRQERLQQIQRKHLNIVATEQIDVTKADAPERLLTLIGKTGGMDLYFHASGIGHQNRTLEADIELRTIKTNALGFTRMVGEAYRYFAEQGHGHIAVISSIAGTKGLGPAPAYSATKALQNVYLQALEQQAHQRGLDIAITDIRPGFVDTALLAGDFRYPLMLKPERVAREIVASINRKRHIRVIDWKYRILTSLWRSLPRWVWRRLRI